ncbi:MULTISPECIES: hypothetical protein [Lacticaseibacillus]|uniref:Uncharacterized protein n=3 Tax=Lacticaseibacillus zeae TaxID=57037 RepID=A0A5R8LVV0_LACZE|nr:MULTISPECIES: hypothetical protein [Lacticaseibacillus]OFR96078.1 hypothetical protein HMPREF2861_08525 [Lactobacillus sp. HMSC068F07]KLI75505.1 hypothetical protein AAW28_08365 [Lacticaseibacillus casei]KRK13164.1 hypothetical protein FD51_GL001360 [Lacticaseibacillus zeae DSM 20178 = KCTC 3804]MDE3316749.1 hypothetical protein [Lacticaseibacillus zeae]OLS04187.1 hypothetical protein AUQ39_14250 [Lacticaseibacillus casei]
MTTFKRILKRTLIYTVLVLGLAVLMTFGYVGYQDVTAGKGYLALRYLLLTAESVVGGFFLFFIVVSLDTWREHREKKREQKPDSKK